MVKKTKICVRCKKGKPIEDYGKHSRTKGGRRNTCKQCEAKTRRRWRLSERGKLSAQKYAKSKKGKAVSRKAQLKYINNNPVKSKLRYRKHRLKKAFGITVEQYDEMFKRQGGCCAICGDTNIKYGRRLAVDHHHTTGEIRGLLCNQCNRALGYFHDDIHRLTSAIKYLSREA